MRLKKLLLLAGGSILTPLSFVACANPVAKDPEQVKFELYIQSLQGMALIYNKNNESSYAKYLNKLTSNAIVDSKKPNASLAKITEKLNEGLKLLNEAKDNGYTIEQQIEFNNKKNQPEAPKPEPEAPQPEAPKSENPETDKEEKSNSFVVDVEKASYSDVIANLTKLLNKRQSPVKFDQLEASKTLEYKDLFQIYSNGYIGIKSGGDKDNNKLVSYTTKPEGKYLSGSITTNENKKVVSLTLVISEGEKVELDLSKFKDFEEQPSQPGEENPKAPSVTLVDGDKEKSESRNESNENENTAPGSTNQPENPVATPAGSENKPTSENNDSNSNIETQPKEGNEEASLELTTQQKLDNWANENAANIIKVENLKELYDAILEKQKAEKNLPFIWNSKKTGDINELRFNIDKNHFITLKLNVELPENYKLGSLSQKGNFSPKLTYSYDAQTNILTLTYYVWFNKEHSTNTYTSTIDFSSLTTTETENDNKEESASNEPKTTEPNPSNNDNSSIVPETTPVNPTDEPKATDGISILNDFSTKEQAEKTLESSVNFVKKLFEYFGYNTETNTVSNTSSTEPFKFTAQNKSFSKSKEELIDQWQPTFDVFKEGGTHGTTAQTAYNSLMGKINTIKEKLNSKTEYDEELKEELASDYFDFFDNNLNGILSQEHSSNDMDSLPENEIPSDDHNGGRTEESGSLAVESSPLTNENNNDNSTPENSSNPVSSTNDSSTSTETLIADSPAEENKQEAVLFDVDKEKLKTKIEEKKVDLVTYSAWKSDFEVIFGMKGGGDRDDNKIFTLKDDFKGKLQYSGDKKNKKNKVTQYYLKADYNEGDKKLIITYQLKDDSKEYTFTVDLN